jgi:hypothetical protein
VARGCRAARIHVATRNLATVLTAMAAYSRASGRWLVRRRIAGASGGARERAARTGGRVRESSGGSRACARTSEAQKASRRQIKGQRTKPLARGRSGGCWRQELLQAQRLKERRTAEHAGGRGSASRACAAFPDAATGCRGSTKHV